MNGYQGLTIWQKSMDLVVLVYQLVKLLPKEETYALSDQLRRAVVSIPSNIAEGYGRGTAKEVRYFLTVARGSKSEVETQLMICERLGYLHSDQIQKPLQLCDEIGKMLYSLTTKLTTDN
jgi:four helix bundle protein